MNINNSCFYYQLDASSFNHLVNRGSYTKRAIKKCGVIKCR